MISRAKNILNWKNV